MANIFLDTNIFFDIATRDTKKAKLLKNHRVFISPLSCHIYCYSEHVILPDKIFNSFLEKFDIVNFSSKILNEAMKGPTPDLEDNIQLHSAAKSDSDYFLTTDKKLLKMRYFGKVKIVNKL